MSEHITADQQRAARVVGIAYLAAIVLSFFAELYVNGTLYKAGDAGATLAAITAHQTLFRLGIAANLTAFIVDVFLVVALYVVLARVNRLVALTAAAIRLVETAIITTSVLRDLDVARLAGETGAMGSFTAPQVAALARASLMGHASAYLVALILAGIGSTMFAALWWRSRYVPRALAGLGVVASAVLAAGTFTLLVYPAAASVISVTTYGPLIFLFELIMGIWLIARPLR